MSTYNYYAMDYNRHEKKQKNKKKLYTELKFDLKATKA